MGHSVLSTLHSRLGKPEKAYEIFQRSFKPNEVPPFGVISETAGGTNPYFATGAGGMLQAVFLGLVACRYRMMACAGSNPIYPQSGESLNKRHWNRQKDILKGEINHVNNSFFIHCETIILESYFLKRMNS